MASLTDYTDTVNSGKRIVEPERTSGSSFLGGLSRLASQGMEALGSYNNQNQRIQQQARIEGGRNVENQIESFVLNAKADATASMRVADDPSISELGEALAIPRDVQEQAIALDRQRRAVAQGRQAQEAYDLKLEKFVTEMNNKYPDYSADIGRYMKERGFDHVLWREQKLADAMETGGDAAQVSAYQSVIGVAVEAGYGRMGLTNAQLYDHGLRFLENKAKAEAAEKAKNAEREAAKEDREAGDHARRRSMEAISASASAQVNLHLGTLVDTVQNVAKSADNDDAAYERLASMHDDLNMVMDRYGQHIVQQLQAEGADKATEDRIRAQIDDRKKAVNDIFMGPSSRFAARNRAYTTMTQTLGMDAEKALPFYMFAKRVLGASGVEGIFGGDMSQSMSPQLISKIKAEVANWDPTNRNEGLNILAEVGALARGNIKLSDISPDKLNGDYIRLLNTTAKQAAINIQDAEPDSPDENAHFLNSFGTVALAGIQFTPATKDLRALEYTIFSVTSDRNMRVLEAMLKNPEYRDRARPVMFATRQAAATVLEATRGTAEAQRLTLNRNGVFVAKTLPGGVAPAIMDETGTASFRSPSTGGQRPEDVKAAQIMNRAINHLASTAVLDPQFAGYSHQELVAHYSGQKRLPPKTEGEKPPVDVQRNLDELEQEIQVMSKSIEEDMPFKSPTSDNRSLYEPMAHRAGAAFGVPASVMSFVLGQESNWDPNIGRTKIDNDGDGKPDSTAVGIAQFTVGTGKIFGLVGDDFDHRGNPIKSITAAAKYLGQLKKRTGSWEKALNAYGVIDRRNFKSEKQYQDVLNRARAAINSSGD